MASRNQSSPPSAPLMVAPPAPVTDSPVEPFDDGVADIPDPVTPPEVMQAVTTGPLSQSNDSLVNPTPDDRFAEHEALLSGFAQVLQKRIEKSMLDYDKSIMSTMEMTLDTIKRWVETTTQANEHATYSMADALQKLHEKGMTVINTPYKATIKTVNAHGFPVIIEIAKHEAGDLVQALGGLMEWLSSQGYSPAEEGARM